MTDDAELLRRFVEDQSEVAFAELVNRHVQLVYAVAVRRLGSDRRLAQDVAQTVFIDLARKARHLSRNIVLTGWLFTSARYAASRMVRTENRRRDREQKLSNMSNSDFEARTIDWDALRPLIDELVGKLSERDRQAVLLRFFEGCDYPEVGTKLAMSADGARTRVNRALEKLQSMLARRGVASTTAALTAVLTSQPVLALPEGLATSVTTAAVSAATVGKTAAGILIFMSINKAIVGFASALAAAGLVGFILQHQTNLGLRAEIEGLRGQAATNAALRAENARLSKSARDLANELDSTRSAQTDLVRAREEIATLTSQVSAARAQSNPNSATAPNPPVAGMIPTSAWTNAGMDTPAASYETAMWAHRQADVDALARLITFGDAERAKVAALFANLPEEARAKYESPEKMIALIFATGPDHAGFKILSQTPQGEKNMSVDVLVQTNDGRVDKAQILFSRSAGGWQMVVPAGEVSSQIRKVTGEPAPKS